MALWHWHPIFVHFTVALLLIASLLFIISALFPAKSWTLSCLSAAKWMFWLGIIAALLTAASGLLAYFTVPNIDAATRAAINKHFISAVLTATLYLILAFFLWRRQRLNLPPSKRWTAWLVLGIILLCVTGYLGGNLVFVRGVGVDTASPSSSVY